jgi:hypothetical protein
VKFPDCESCLHRQDELVCDECEKSEGYEIDESLIEMAHDGTLRLSGRFMGHWA